jgi:hypothetical protein
VRIARRLAVAAPLLALALAARAAGAQTPARACSPNAEPKALRALSTDLRRAQQDLAAGRAAQAEAGYRDLVKRAAAMPSMRCFPPAELGLALALDKQTKARPELASEALAVLVGVRELDTAGFPGEWKRAVADAGKRLDELVRRRLDAGRARLDANDAPGAEAIARELRQLFVDTRVGASGFAASTALYARALWRDGKHVDARKAFRELEGVRLDELDAAAQGDVTEALDEHRARPSLTIRVHVPEGVALSVLLDGERVETGAPLRVDPDRDHPIVVEAPGFERIEAAVRPTEKEEVFERTPKESLAPPPAGAKAEDVARFGEGAAAFADKRWLDASAAFEAAAPSAARTYDLARCEEERGVPVRAWALYQGVLAQKGPSPPWLGAHAARHAAVVAAALARVSVELDAPTATVTVDGQPIGPAPSGEAVFAPGLPRAGARLPARFTLLVERGPHTLAVTQAGFAPSEVALDANGPQAVTLRRGERRASDLRRPLGIAGTIAGGVGVVLGAGLGIAAINGIDGAKNDPKLCPDKRCSPAGLDKVSQARAEGWGSTVSFAVGAPLLVAGLVLWAPWRDPAKEPDGEAPRVAFAPLVGPRLGGLSLSGRLP